MLLLDDNARQEINKSPCLCDNVTIANVGSRVAINFLDGHIFIGFFLGYIDFQGPGTNDHDHRFFKALIGCMAVSLWITQGHWNIEVTVGKHVKKSEWESDKKSYTFENG